MNACPACSSTDLRLGPASHATGRAIARCRACGATFWGNGSARDAEVIELDEVSQDGSAQQLIDSVWTDLKRGEVGPEAWRAVTAKLQDQLPADALVYDIGAGDGGYPALARDEFGFRVSGNDVVEGAVRLAKTRHDVDLELGDISEHGHDGDLDAVTMWCVLAHVPDGAKLLRDVNAALKPGGLLYLQTPRCSKVDKGAQLLQRATKGRVNKLADRRIAEHHTILHTEKSIRIALERAGFTDIRVEASPRYALTSRAYLASMNPPKWLLEGGSKAMDAVIESRLAPRIVLDVYARKPLA